MRRATGCICVITPPRGFQFTPVMRRATLRILQLEMPVERFNSRPSCDGRRECAASTNIPDCVSIHARHATGDREIRRSIASMNCFNSRPSCDGRRGRRGQGDISPVRFNSRPSCDGRLSAYDNTQGNQCFNSRPSCDGRRRRGPLKTISHYSFNSRPSCDGRPEDAELSREIAAFQFTPLMRRATKRPRAIKQRGHVSIHARHATGDAMSLRRLSRRASFNSRPSCDGRLSSVQTNL